MVLSIVITLGNKPETANAADNELPDSKTRRIFPISIIKWLISFFRHYLAQRNQTDLNSEQLSILP